MKDLPYFRWYTADAKADEKYCGMSDQELGFYHRCLNHSWDNNGLPADLNDLAGVMHVSKSYLEKIWPKVGRCFYERDGRLFNKRQERERERAANVSENNKRAGNANASRENREREKNAPPRAQARADSDSDSDSDSSFEVKRKTSLREVPKTQEVVRFKWPPGFDLGAWLEERDRKHPIPGAPQLAIQYAEEMLFVKFTPEQFNEVHDAWCDYWKTQDGGVPTLAKFIYEAWWRKRPPTRSPPKKESWTEGVKRDIKESIERTGKPW